MAVAFLEWGTGFAELLPGVCVQGAQCEAAGQACIGVRVCPGFIPKR